MAFTLWAIAIRLGFAGLTVPRDWASAPVPMAAGSTTPFGSVSLTASGFNLAYNAWNTPAGTNFDPNVAGVGVGNGRGFDFLNGPSAKRYGGSIKLTF